MIGMLLLRGLILISILFLMVTISGLYKVFEKMPDNRFSNDKSWVAFGILWEAILIFILAVKLITG